MPLPARFPAFEVFLGHVSVKCMENEIHARQTDETFRNLYPTLTETQLKQAESNLRRYFEIADEIWKDRSFTGADFDTFSNPGTIEERSNEELKI